MNGKCPHCGEKISTWKKWQLTDNRFGRKCPECGRSIVLPLWYVRMIQVLNIGLAVLLWLISRSINMNSTLFLVIGAAGLILLNIIAIQTVAIKKGTNT